MGIWRHLRAIVLLPVMVTVIIPATIISFTDSLRIGWGFPLPWSWLPALVGCALIGLGLLLMYRTISLFATLGEGTLAPWDATQKLVVRGVYRHVRNPMISGVFSILLGEAALTGSFPLLCWFLFFLVVNLFYIPLFEERDLSRRFGKNYRLYRENVPRWVPRLTPWIVPFDQGPDSGEKSESA